MDCVSVHSGNSSKSQCNFAFCFCARFFAGFCCRNCARGYLGPAKSRALAQNFDGSWCVFAESAESCVDAVWLQLICEVKCFFWALLEYARDARVRIIDMLVSSSKSCSPWLAESLSSLLRSYGTHRTLMLQAAASHSTLSWLTSTPQPSSHMQTSSSWLLPSCDRPLTIRISPGIKPRFFSTSSTTCINATLVTRTDQTSSENKSPQTPIG